MRNYKHNLILNKNYLVKSTTTFFKLSFPKSFSITSISFSMFSFLNFKNCLLSPDH